MQDLVVGPAGQRIRFDDTYFDQVYPQSDNSVKKICSANDVICLSIADSYIPPPLCLRETVANTALEPHQGYTMPIDADKEVIGKMLQNKFGLEVTNDAIRFNSGVGSGISIAAKLSIKSGGKLIIISPCWPHFYADAEKLGAETVRCPFNENDGVFSLDFEALGKAVQAGAKHMLFCNPHNPTGHVFSREELTALGNWAVSNGVTIISDEIFADVILTPGMKHISMSSLGDEISSRTITLMSPTKAFGVSSYRTGFAVVTGSGLRKEYDELGIPGPELPGLRGMLAAYSLPDAEAWRKAVVDYYRVNRDLISSTLLPYKNLVRVNNPHATYFSWIDCSACGWDNPSLEFQKRGRLLLSNGSEYLSPQHVRLVFAVQRPILRDALERMTEVLKERAQELGNS